MLRIFHSQNGNTYRIEVHSGSDDYGYTTERVASNHYYDRDNPWVAFDNDGVFRSRGAAIDRAFIAIEKQEAAAELLKFEYDLRWDATSFPAPTHPFRAEQV